MAHWLFSYMLYLPQVIKMAGTGNCLFNWQKLAKWVLRLEFEMAWEIKHLFITPEIKHPLFIPYFNSAQRSNRHKLAPLADSSQSLIPRWMMVMEQHRTAHFVSGLLFHHPSKSPNGRICARTYETPQTPPHFTTPCLKPPAAQATLTNGRLTVFQNHEGNDMQCS